MQGLDAGLMLSLFKRKFIYLLLATLFFVIILNWGIYYGAFARQAQFLINKEAQTIEATFLYLKNQEGIHSAQHYLMTLKKNATVDVELVVYYDVIQEMVTASTRLEWIGMPLQALPEKNVQEDIQYALKSGKTHEGMRKHHGVFDLTVNREGGVFMIHIPNSDVFKFFLYSSLLNQSLIGLSLLAFTLITFGWVFPHFFYPFLRKLTEVVRSSPLYLGKFHNKVREDLGYRFGIMTFVKELVKEIEEVIFQEIWVNRLFENQPIGLLLSNGEGEVIFANDKMGELLGISPRQALGEGWKDLLLPEEQQHVVALWTQAVKEQTSLNFQCRFKTPHGLINWTDVHIVPIRDLNDEVIGIIGTFTSINQLKHLEADMSHVEALGKDKMETQKSNLISIISHQLRTPLSVIQESLEIIKEMTKEKGGEEADEFITICRNNTHKIIEMVRDILSYQEIAFGYKKWNFEKVETKPFFGEIYKRFEKLFKEKGIDLVMEIEGALPPLFVDKNSLEKAAENLVRNALIFTEKGRVVMRAFKKEEAIVFEVEDTGIGIREEDKKNLFTLFSQIHSSNMRFGSGLGLVLVKKIVEYHKGNVSYESTFGKGSTFRFEIPLEVKNG